MGCNPIFCGSPGHKDFVWALKNWEVATKQNMGTIEPSSAPLKLGPLLPSCVDPRTSGAHGFVAPFSGFEWVLFGFGRWFPWAVPSVSFFD